MLEEKDLTWLACFLDTDGTLYLYKWENKSGVHTRIYIAFYNKNRAILEKAASLLLGGIYFHGRKGIDSRGIKRGSNYLFKVSQANNYSEHILKALLPYLIVKKDKAIDYLSKLIA